MAHFLATYKWSLIVCGAASVLGFFPLMGAPGILVMVPSPYIIKWITGKPFAGDLGEASWPIAIGYAFVIPWVVFLFHYFLGKVSFMSSGVVHWIGVTILSLVFLFFSYWLCCHPIAVEREAKEKASRESPGMMRNYFCGSVRAFSRSDDYSFAARISDSKEKNIFDEFAEQVRIVKSRPEVFVFSSEQMSQIENFNLRVQALKSVPIPSKSFDAEKFLQNNPEWQQVRAEAEVLYESLWATHLELLKKDKN